MFSCPCHVNCDSLREKEGRFKYKFLAKTPVYSAFIEKQRNVLLSDFCSGKKGLPKDIECDTGTMCYPEVHKLLVGSAFFV